MGIISYAQNFEDVMLWRALGHIKGGVYIDVGAYDPLVDSVSKAFYEHGWRGIHLEPLPVYCNALRLDRPDPADPRALASGVVYHQKNPVELLSLLAGRARHLFIWTHYYDAQFVAARQDIGRYFEPQPLPNEVAGFAHHLYRKRYAEALEWKGFCGGGDIDTSWLTKADLLGALQNFGFEIVETWDERKDGQPTNPNGPSILIAARAR